MCDRLGASDLRGWQRAKSLLMSIDTASNVHTTPGSFFLNLKTISFGIWDDGRWSVYRDKEKFGSGRRHYLWDDGEFLVREGESWDQYRADYDGQERALRSSYPIIYLQVVLARLLSMVASAQVRICHHVGDPSKKGTDLLTLRIIHTKDENGLLPMIPPLLGPTRVYIPVVPLNGDFLLESKMTKSLDRIIQDYGCWMEGIALKVGPSLGGKGTAECEEGPERISLVLCLVPVKLGDEEQLQVAQRIRTALEDYQKAEAKNQEYAKACLGKITILVGDEVPACPCCGMTSVVAYR
jgi:hypothetical protein